MVMTARQVFFVARGRAELQSIALSAPVDDQVLIESCYSVVSPGTEMAVFRGLPNTNVSFPHSPGYSLCGRVLGCGAAVGSVREGGLVVTAAPHASHVLRPASSCFPVAESVDPLEAAAYRLAVIAMQGVRRGQVQLGESVLVIGLGVIGQLAGQIAHLAGATTVAGIDPLAPRRELALQMGFDQAVEHAQAVDQEGRWDTVIEATGAPAPINDALHLARRLGRVVLLGSSRGETSSVNFYRDVHRKGLTLLGAHEVARPKYEDAPTIRTTESDSRIVLQLLAQNRLKLRPLISRVVPHEQAPLTYQSIAANGASVMTVALDWRRS